MKLKFQMAFMSFLLTSFFTLLESDLVAAIAQETSTEEGKKTESKEPAVKQAKEKVEEGLKITEENKKDVQPENLERPLTKPKEIKDEKEKPIIFPLKPDLDLSEVLKGLKLDLGRFIEPKQEEVKEKPKPTAVTVPPVPQPAAAQPPAPAKVPEVKPVQSPATTSGISDREERLCNKTASNIHREEAQITKLTNEQEIDNLCTQFLTQVTCAEGKPDMGKQDVAKSDLTNGKVRSELNAIKEVESAVDVNCGRGI